MIFRVITIILILNIPFFSTSQFGDAYHVAHTNSYAVDYTSAADLDGDGDKDLIVCDGIGNVNWRENVGNSVFAAPQLITKNLTDSNRALARDLDNDGDLDLLVSCKYTDKVVWFRNDGNGNFGPEQLISNNADEVVDILTLDIDNDGDLDVASAANNNHKITVFANNGSGQFSAGFNMPPLVVAPNAISVGDFNNDGFQDIIAAHYFHDIVWFPNLGNGTFDSLEVISDSLSNCLTVTSGDIDGDGLFDAVSASSTENNVVWYKNLGGGNFGVEQLIGSGLNQVRQAVTNDFDNDGDLDVIASSYVDSLIVWYENDGNGNFSSPYIVFQAYADVYGFTIDDINIDGLKDLAVSGQTTNGRSAIVLLNQGGGLFGPPEQLYNNSNGVTSVFSADISGDGLKDILSTSNQDDEVCWYKNLGEGRWGKQRIINKIANDPQSVCAVDIDGDGDVDIVSAARLGKVYWYENFGADSIGSPILLEPNATWLGNVHTADIDGDGDQDILFSSGDNDLVGWFINLGGGVFGPVQTVATLNGVQCVWTADIDGDLDLDLICSVGGNTNAVNWVQNLGSGTFGPVQVISSLANNCRAIRAADFDGDGDQDVATVSALDDKLAWYENLGGGTFAPQVVLSVLANYGLSLDVKDIDGDGDPDIAVASAYNKNVFWVENLGGGNFSDERLVGEDMDECHFVIIDDVDNDGDQDAVAGVWGNVVTNKGDGVRVFANQDVNPLQARGKIYYDQNQNGELDSLEQGLGFQPIVVNPNLSFAYTYADGDYFVNFPSGVTSTYTLQPDISLDWMITSDSASYSLMVDSSFVFLDSMNFGLYPTNIFDSLNTELVSGFSRCNDTINFTISLNNLGTTLPSGVLHLELADSLEYVGSSFVPDSIIGQNIYWSYNSIFFYSNNIYTIQVFTGSIASVGIPVQSNVTASVFDSSNVLTYTDSTSLITNIVCAYDPNDKISDPVGIDSLGFIDPLTEYLDYTIRFQNTGNDTALIVRIEDLLDPNLEWSSIDLLAYSHDVHMDYYPNGQIEFVFNDIYLPDSTTNFLGSQGFVKYRIYVDSNTTIGTSIYNTANIFFDLNPAVVTNTKILTLYDCDLSLNNINDTIILCENDVLSISDVSSTTQFDWNISGVSSGITSEINWIADTAGIFQFYLNKSNEFCNIDTTVVLDVKAQQPVQVLNLITACAGESIIIFGEAQSTSGIYIDTLVNIWNCDSVVSQELLLFPTIPVQDIGLVSICEGDSVLFFGSYVMTAGTYYDSLTTINGCDSVLMQSLFVQSSSPNNQPALTICEGDSVQIFGNYISTSGIFIDTLQSSLGCDSIVQQELIVAPIIPIQDLGTVSICANDSLLVFNQYVSTSGIYYDTLQGASSCDSIQMLVLEVFPEVLVSFGSLTDDTICMNHPPIPLGQGTPAGGIYSGNGVVNSEFNPNSAGIGLHTLSYTYLDINNCENVDQVEILVDACAEIDQMDMNTFQVYPNPTSLELFINFGDNYALFESLEIVNVLGVKVIEVNEISTAVIRIPVDDLSAGSYFIYVTDALDFVQHRVKVIVE